MRLFVPHNFPVRLPLPLLLILTLAAWAGMARAQVLNPFPSTAPTPAPVVPPPRLIDPPELVLKRNEHLAEVERATATLTANYVKMLQTLKHTYSMEGNLAGVESVQAELRKLPDAAKQAVARTLDRSKIIHGISIVSAQYRDVTRKHSFDITERVRKVFESGVESMLMSTGNAANGKDPLLGRPKETVLIYTVEGEARELRIPEGAVLNFKTDLK